MALTDKHSTVSCSCLLLAWSISLCTASWLLSGLILLNRVTFTEEQQACDAYDSTCGTCGLLLTSTRLHKIGSSLPEEELSGHPYPDRLTDSPLALHGKHSPSNSAITVANAAEAWHVRWRLQQSIVTVPPVHNHPNTQRVRGFTATMHTALLRAMRMRCSVQEYGVTADANPLRSVRSYTILYARPAAAATAAALYARNDPCLPEFDAELSAAYAPDYMGAAVWNGLHTRDGWFTFARTCHNTAHSHRVCPDHEAALTHTDTFVVGGAKLAACKEIRSEISAAALVRRGLRQPTHRLHGRPRETAQHRRPRWVADLRNPSARDPATCR